MAKMREMVESRCRFAKTSIAEAFDDEETLNRLCEMSGGHPRHLMMFLQSACNELDELPITREAAEKAIRKYGNALLREVPDAAWGKHSRNSIIPSPTSRRMTSISRCCCSCSCSST